MLVREFPTPPNPAGYLPRDSIRLLTTTIEFDLSDATIDVQAVAECLDAIAQMPAFSATNVAVLTIYDMCKSADPMMTIGPVELIERARDPSPHGQFDVERGE